MASNGRNTYAWRQVRAYVYATQTHCGWCGEYVDQTLPRWHRMSRTADHPTAIASGGHVTAQGGTLMHRKCNSEKEAQRRRDLGLDSRGRPKAKRGLNAGRYS